MVIKSKEILYGIQYNEVQDNIIEQVWLDIVVHVPNKKKTGDHYFLGAEISSNAKSTFCRFNQSRNMCFILLSLPT